jgi:hypothetical protein
MSRGPGKRQRDIMQAIGQSADGHCWLVDLLPRNYTRAEYNAMYRAAYRLSDQQLIDLALFSFGKETVALYRRGTFGTREGGRPKRKR